ncbi:PREDICTED: uncharacterized protein C1orf106 homolog [Crocodylus porosus]|uniref:Innate immunity activator n=1 Tax=Crocodylus porosus TaxID=8502 RepID=A0A7M4EA38_CROPO|nr:PREDICTED: uncharacterized protein C1orf106 homolog [Crocodylus porosus]XP_019401850.1 PREDICTED: uncharacterized protein C1orf106 homolog [Crocodylus porosus]
MEGKDEISDTDSGIILQSGQVSPVSPLKDLTKAVHKQQKALEAHLEACLQELRKLCLREAELTGMLPQEYPLKPGEKPPKVRQRIGTAFKLDEKTIVSQGADPLSRLERDLSLQMQIVQAAHHLFREENISKQIKKRRKSAVLKEERKMKELENALNECRLMAGQKPMPKASTTTTEELSISDDRSLLDTNLQEEEYCHAPNHQAVPELLVPVEPGTPNSTLALPSCLAHPKKHKGPQPACCEIAGLERTPIQNSPWKETSLDKPYEKPKKPSLESSNVSRVEACQDYVEPRGRSMLPRRRPTYYTITVPSYCFPLPKPSVVSNPTYHSSSDDSNSDVSSISYATSPGSSSPDIFLRPVPPPAIEQPSPTLRGQIVDRPGAVYYYQTSQQLLLPPCCIPTMEYVSESHMVAAREFSCSRPSLGTGGPPLFSYEEDRVPMRYQRLVPSQSRIVRTPSLKDYATARGRTLSKSAVTEELKSWHERTRLRNSRPHSLDRQGTFRMCSGPGGELYALRSPMQRVQVPQIHILKRSPEGAPVQVYVPENGEIITQV